MSTFELLQLAIKNKQKISFTYKTKDERIGDPYAIFVLAGTETTKIDIVQTDGYSQSKDKNPFPSFRMYNLEDIENLKVLTEIFGEPYHIEYVQDSPRYKNYIVKI